MWRKFGIGNKITFISGDTQLLLLTRKMTKTTRSAPISGPRIVRSWIAYCRNCMYQFWTENSLSAIAHRESILWSETHQKVVEHNRTCGVLKLHGHMHPGSEMPRTSALPCIAAMRALPWQKRENIDTFTLNYVKGTQISRMFLDKLSTIREKNRDMQNYAQVIQKFRIV